MSVENTDETYTGNVGSSDLPQTIQQCHSHTELTNKNMTGNTTAHHSASESRKAVVIRKRRGEQLDHSTPPPKRSIDSRSSRVSRSYKDYTNEGEGKRRLACPFFKYNPSKYVSERTCSGPGWSSVHRLKCVVKSAYSKQLEFANPITENIFSGDMCYRGTSVPAVKCGSMVRLICCNTGIT